MKRKPKVFSFFDKGSIDSVGVTREQYDRLVKHGKRRMRKLERADGRRQIEEEQR